MLIAKLNILHKCLVVTPERAACLATPRMMSSTAAATGDVFYRSDGSSSTTDSYSNYSNQALQKGRRRVDTDLRNFNKEIYHTLDSSPVHMDTKGPDWVERTAFMDCLMWDGTGSTFRTVHETRTYENTIASQTVSLSTYNFAVTLHILIARLL